MIFSMLVLKSASVHFCFQTFNPHLKQQIDVPLRTLFSAERQISCHIVDNIYIHILDIFMFIAMMDLSDLIFLPVFLIIIMQIIIAVIVEQAAAGFSTRSHSL